ncbi:peptidoglycan DD-metalloendopeptidase family protein [Arthrobacter sp.]|uniref:M23 family metallopeptidase n=1 Tax=Arthrobacter sp. TaxID=1667 RepID=UPI002810DD5F|nr:peptidoglycan DD-metalloendopeptidase family protein [Arthrobacter sp.]
MKALIPAVLLLLIAPPASQGAAPPAIEEPRGSWSWPLSPQPAVLREFDPPDKPWLSGHRGVDLKAEDPAQVISPESGTVTFVGVVVDRPVITIDHGGIKSSFEPVESTLVVGTAVSKGDVIGTVLAGHCGDAPCLHWGVRRGEEYLNPLSFVRDLRPSVLLPLTARGP